MESESNSQSYNPNELRPKLHQLDTKELFSTPVVMNEFPSSLQVASQESYPSGTHDSLLEKADQRESDKLHPVSIKE